MLGRSNGDVVVADDRFESRILLNTGSAVRDLAAHPTEPTFYAICEDGTAYYLSAETGDVRAKFRSPVDEPFWALAFNPARGLLAVAERHEHVYLLDGKDLSVKKKMPGPGHTKRMRWFDDDRLLIGFGSYLYELDVRSGKVQLRLPSQMNSIEDFGWTPDRRYFAFVTYFRELGLVDLQRWEVIHRVAIDMDFVHGVLWLDPTRNPDAWPYELMTFGRSGQARRYRVHDERLIWTGYANAELSTPIHDARGIEVV
jgi:hypothetical protein